MSDRRARGKGRRLPSWAGEEPLYGLFETAGSSFVAGAWREQGGTLATVAQALGCDEETALFVGLCLAPWPGCDLDLWSGKVATRFGLARDRVWLVGWTLSAREGPEPGRSGPTPPAPGGEGVGATTEQQEG